MNVQKCNLGGDIVLAWHKHGSSQGPEVAIDPALRALSPVSSVLSRVG